MISRQDARALVKIEALRARRLDLAELELLRANAALERALGVMALAQASLSSTAERCRLEHRQLNEALASGPAMAKDRIFEWKQAHVRLDARLAAAQRDSDAAQAGLLAEQKKRDAANRDRRAVALAVERLKAMLASPRRTP